MSSTGSNNIRFAVWEWAQVALLVGNLGWTTLCLGGYRPETMVVTTALTGALVVVHLAGWSALNATRAKATAPTTDGGGAGAAARSAGEAGDDGTARRGQRAPLRFHPAGWMMLPFLVYAAANVRWVTPVPWLGWLDWVGWAQLIAVFWVVLNGVRSPRVRATLFGALVLLGLVAVLLAAYQKFVRPDWLMMGRTQAPQFIGRAGGPFGIPNSLAALLLLLLPPLVALTRRRGAGAVQRVLCGYIVLVLALGLVLTVSRGAWLALVLAAGAWPWWAGGGGWRRRLVASAAVAGGLVAMLAVLYFSVPLVRERLVTMKRDSGEITRPIMWRGAWRIFAAQPVWGGGAGSFNVLFDAHRPERYQDEPRWAHNDYLNTLSDYGLAGFALFFGAAAAIAVRGVRRGKTALAPPVRAGAVSAPGGRPTPAGERSFVDEPGFLAAVGVGLGAFGLQLFVDFHFKIPALCLVFASLAGLAVQRVWPRATPGAARNPRLVVAAAALGAAAIWTATLLWVRPIYRGEALRYGARQAIDRLAGEEFSRPRWATVLGAARASLSEAVALAPANGAAWADLAYATALTVHVAPERKAELAREAGRAAERALALSRVVPVFWVRRGVALDMQGRWEEADAAFHEAVRLAPTRASIWFNYAFHLRLNRATLERARVAVDFCLRLDPANREAQALRQRLADHTRVP